MALVILLLLQIQEQVGMTNYTVQNNQAIFELYHGENKLIFNEMMMRSALY